MDNTTFGGLDLNFSDQTTNSISKSQEEVYCSVEKCVPADVIIVTIAVIGVVANATVMVVILHSNKLRKPIYIGISMLALPDLIFLTGNLFIVLSKYFFTLGYQNTNVLYVFILTAYFTSTCHVVLLSLQQYFYLAYPLKSHVWFTVRRMWYVSLTAWVISAIPAILYMCILIFFREDENISPKSRHIFLQVLTFLSSLVPVIALAVLFVLKRRALRNALTDRRSKPVKRMSRLVGFVVIAYLACTTPVNIRDIMKYSFEFKAQSPLELFYSHISFILLYCNFTINPFLYFIMTPRFRETCRRRKLTALFGKVSKDESYKDETASTSV